MPEPAPRPFTMVPNAGNPDLLTSQKEPVRFNPRAPGSSKPFHDHHLTGASQQPCTRSVSPKAETPQQGVRDGTTGRPFSPTQSPLGPSTQHLPPAASWGIVTRDMCTFSTWTRSSGERSGFGHCLWFPRETIGAWKSCRDGLRTITRTEYLQEHEATTWRDELRLDSGGPASDAAETAQSILTPVQGLQQVMRRELRGQRQL